uniref:NAD(P)-dependent dehydrogenase, short-chain alcohol dehydrogenase family n=1 Tax=Candidatus Kentrum sp. FM TaxID=2126340 RepID=A0A450VWG8_9GAMM|nr:MAG: NAD(P)-dependent dehydrogenase, short-chain alcohol dehydrogenase family [Candidatus Kentron sp. FM]VFJ51731.1 MAG: NAD(P)-dependent dehydrogenase, short-chain alcohol dehydrogenase family [Candidatus Kentron sp. FM]VFK09095.1 MAG: NAD(P)-dependent dehydrogenase, short-chain alcohol dehydrogenase family [Candidatus Kentron sp. FM]
MNTPTQQTILVTGVSAGIGNALARHHLENGHRVLGTSRRRPEALLEYAAFRFVSADLGQPESIPPAIAQLIGGIGRLDLVILNAGILGHFGELGEAALSDLNHTMQVNVWANKLILDGLFDTGMTVGQVVAISSGAAVNGNRGWSGYSISKAALNMLIKLYGREQPDTHFCALSPGLVDTIILERLCAREPDARYPSLDVIKSKRDTPEMPTPEQAAPELARAMTELPRRVESGEYADIRLLYF